MSQTNLPMPSEDDRSSAATKTIQPTPRLMRSPAKIRGRDLVRGTPKEIVVTQDDLCRALSDPVSNIIDAVKMALETSPPELASDIVDRGVVMTGGGAMLKNLDYALSEATGLPVFIAPQPLYCVAIGAGRVLSNCKKHAHILFKQT